MIYGNMSDLTACSVKSCNDLSIYDDTAADTLERARELLGGVDSAID